MSLFEPAPLHLLVEHAAREFGGAGGDQEVEELLLQPRLHAVPVDMVPVGRLLEMALVRVGFHLRQKLVPVGADRAHVDRVELVEIGGVEARREQRVLHGERGRAFAVMDGLRLLDGQALLGGRGVGGVLERCVHSVASSLNENSQSSMNSKSPVIRVQSRSSFEARVIRAMRFSTTTSP
jgi:hypothetical protein